jgi:DNA helicase IV
MDPFLLDVLTQLRRDGNDKAVDIIETIQKEQNEIVRLKNKSLYVQGCAGSGKTMILLHRLSITILNRQF